MTRPTDRAVERKLEALAKLSADADRASRNAELERALADSSYRVVAKAAERCEEFSLRERCADLKGAYARLLEDPIKRDPNCTAKQAIVRALVSLDFDDVEFYLAGIRYRQLEPVWGGSEDTAIDIRCSCAMGLVASGYSRALVSASELLVDPEFRARAGAVRAIRCANPQAAEPTALDGDGSRGCSRCRSDIALWA